MQSGKVKQHFDDLSSTWRDRYDKPRSISDYELVRRQQLTRAILSKQVSKSDAFVLEVGCGAGNVLASIIEDHPGWRGLGLDISDQMINSCQEKYRDQSHLSFEVFDIQTGILNYHADAIVALGVLGYLDEPELALRNLHQMLKPTGYLILEVNKFSIPYALTKADRRIKALLRPKRYNRSELNHAFEVNKLINLLQQYFALLKTYDYSYLPYVSGLRRLVKASQFIEKYLGAYVTPFSSTTLFVFQKQNTETPNDAANQPSAS